MSEIYLTLSDWDEQITDIQSKRFESVKDGFFGFNGYIKFKSGILICYGKFSKLSNGDSVKFLEPYQTPYYALTITRTNDLYETGGSKSPIWTTSKGTDGFRVEGGSYTDASNGIYGDYIAIGFGNAL